MARVRYFIVFACFEFKKALGDFLFVFDRYNSMNIMIRKSTKNILDQKEDHSVWKLWMSMSTQTTILFPLPLFFLKTSTGRES